MLQLVDGKEHLIYYLNSSVSDTGAHLTNLTLKHKTFTEIQWKTIHVTFRCFTEHPLTNLYNIP